MVFNVTFNNILAISLQELEGGHTYRKYMGDEFITTFHNLIQFSFYLKIYAK